jgi:SAM-dependent methyltransferase
MSQTTDYYDLHADEYVRSTFEVDMTDLYKPFLKNIPTGGMILDAGCGSGRDALFFYKNGYQVRAFDASREIVMRARDFTSLPVEQREFKDVNEVNIFDGIWACASLVHVPSAEMPQTLSQLWRALKPDGVLYMSFKVGYGHRFDHGRAFTDGDERAVEAWTQNLNCRSFLEVSRSDDRRPAMHTQWLNVLMRKAENACAKQSRLLVDGWSYE